jgi:hypothetical protein
MFAASFSREYLYSQLFFEASRRFIISKKKASHGGIANFLEN